MEKTISVMVKPEIMQVKIKSLWKSKVKSTECQNGKIDYCSYFWWLSNTVTILSNASYFCFPNSTALIMGSSLTAKSSLFLSDVSLKMSLSFNFKIYAIENEVYSRLFQKKYKNAIK